MGMGTGRRVEMEMQIESGRTMEMEMGVAMQM
jgi:hypothetical protein